MRLSASHSLAVLGATASRCPKAPERTFGPALFKADTAELALSTDKQGKVLIVYSGWGDTYVLLLGGRFEL